MLLLEVSLDPVVQAASRPVRAVAAVALRKALRVMATMVLCSPGKGVPFYRTIYRTA